MSLQMQHFLARAKDIKGCISESTAGRLMEANPASYLWDSTLNIAFSLGPFCTKEMLINWEYIERSLKYLSAWTAWCMRKDWGIWICLASRSFGRGIELLSSNIWRAVTGKTEPLFSEVHSERTRYDGHRLQQEKLWLNIHGKNNQCEWLSPETRLPKKTEKSLFLKIFQQLIGQGPAQSDLTSKFSLFFMISGGPFQAKLCYLEISDTVFPVLQRPPYYTRLFCRLIPAFT